MCPGPVSLRLLVIYAPCSTQRPRSCLPRSIVPKTKLLPLPPTSLDSTDPLCAVRPSRSAKREPPKPPPPPSTTPELEAAAQAIEGALPSDLFPLGPTAPPPVDADSRGAPSTAR